MLTRRASNIFWHLGMDYHVVAYTNYELVGLPLPKLWTSFSILQVKSWSCNCQLVLPAGRVRKKIHLNRFPKKKTPLPFVFECCIYQCTVNTAFPGDSILHSPLVLSLRLPSAWGENHLYLKANFKPKCGRQIQIKTKQKDDIYHNFLQVRHIANWLGDRVLKTLLETYRSSFSISHYFPFFRDKHESN